MTEKQAINELVEKGLSFLFLDNATLTALFAQNKQTTKCTRQKIAIANYN